MPKEIAMFKIAFLLAATLIASTAFAQTWTCPETHYPCGTGSCCSR